MTTRSDTPHMSLSSRLHAVTARVTRRLEDEKGFTLVELTIVLLILGILLTVALPTYLTFKDKANKTAAATNVGKALRAVQSYNADNFPGAQNDPNAVTNDNGYSNITLTALATKYDASIPTTPGAPFVLNPAGFTSSSTDFCLTAVSGRWIAAKHGPGGTVTIGTLFTPGSCIAS